MLTSSNDTQSNTFGQDTRQRWKSESSVPYPLDRVGTLRRPDGERCTASYIGKNLILTAAHCVMKHGKNQLLKGDYLFEHIQLPDGGRKESRTVNRFHYVELKQLEDGGFEAAKHHWVIVELNSPISSPERYFGYLYPGDGKYDEYHQSNFDLSIVGFSPEFNGNTRELTFSDANCEIKEHLFNGYVALHDCDSGPRDSGSPLYKCTVSKEEVGDKCHISAIHVGALSEQDMQFDNYSRSHANIAVTMKSYRKAFYYLTVGWWKPYNLKSVDNE